VQLLTVHGAKGLEARVVFVMDSDPEPRKAESAGLLIDWPADDEAPAVCAFVYSEARCPASLAALLAEDEAARRREEFNGLYVAVTRARERIVFSATQPRVPAADPSWRARAEAVGRAWPLAQAAAVSASAVVETEMVVMLPVLPRLDRVPCVPLPAPPTPDDGLARLGQAVHRTLEWATGGAGATVDALASAAAAEFGAPADEVGRVAQAILASPACATFFHGAQIRWSGNEIALGEAGETVRIDRLVLRDEPAGPVWWVLDYKLRGDPQADPVLVEQLRRYRRAVEQAQRGARVRSAFITGNGRLLPVV
jgi:ATP-dependent helicase/nuclease subunit A